MSAINNRQSMLFSPQELVVSVPILRGDGFDNDADGTAGNKVAWKRLPEFAAGGPYSRERISR
jgi:hypothetical protein